MAALAAVGEIWVFLLPFGRTSPFPTVRAYTTTCSISGGDKSSMGPLPVDS